MMMGVMTRAGMSVALVAMVGVLLAGVSAADAADGSMFDDVDGHRHELAIAAMAGSGLFEQIGCAPGRFCPDDPAPRRVVAVWLHNALTSRDAPIAAPVFVEASGSDDSRWRYHADALYEMGVTYGCRVEPLRFCPERAVTRGQLAALLSRAYGFVGTASFDDMAGSIFASDAAGAYEANVMDACATDPLRFCSGVAVTRGELAEALRAAQLADGAARTGSVCALPGTNHNSVGFRGRRQDTTAGMVLPRWADGLSTGRLRTALVFGTYRNRMPEYDTHTEADIQLAELDAYLAAMSYGRFKLDAEVYHGWIEVPFDYLRPVSPADLSGSISQSTRLARSTINQARTEHGLDPSELDAIVVVLPSQWFGGGHARSDYHNFGTGWDPVPVAVVNNSQGALFANSRWWPTAAHEILHLLGAADLYSYTNRPYWQPHDNPPDPDVWVTLEIGLMGMQVRYPQHRDAYPLGFATSDGGTVFYGDTHFEPQEMLGWTRRQMRWLDDSQIACIDNTDTEVVTLTAAAAASPTDMVLAVISHPLPNHAIVVESRRAVGYDSNNDATDPALEYPESTWRLVSEGVLVYTVRADRRSGQLPLLIVPDNGDGYIHSDPVLVEGGSVTVGDPSGVYPAWRIEVLDSTDSGDTIKVTRLAAIRS